MTRRKLNKYQAAFHISVCVWLAFIIWLLCVPKETEAPEPPPVVVSEAPVVKAAPVIVVPEVVEEETDFDKMPMIENATLTHYCICKKCCGKDEDHPAYGITASGRPAEPYLSVAVDPFVIELGSTVYVDYGDGEIHEYRADDTGNFGGAKIDLCVSDHQEALALGVKTVKVWWEEHED